jgi:chromosome segregation ATPase
MTYHLLCTAIAQERDQDASLRARQQTLQTQKASVTQRCTELQTEIAELKQKLELKKKAKEVQREKLKEQLDRNGPELKLLESKTGCSITPTKIGECSALRSCMGAATTMLADEKSGFFICLSQVTNSNLLSI